MIFSGPPPKDVPSMDFRGILDVWRRDGGCQEKDEQGSYKEFKEFEVEGIAEQGEDER
jgi:hypothetical protein